MNMNPLERFDDDIVWALLVRESYNQQLEDSIDFPALTEELLWATPGGNCFSELGKLGLQIANYRDGTFVEPESKHPVRGESQLLSSRREVA